jgi:hypothetical protein
MRWRITFILIALSCTAMAGTHLGAGAVRRAASNDELLASVGIDLTQVKARLPCYASTRRPGDPLEFFYCVYVQDANEINLYSMDGDYLALELTLKLRKIEGIALQEARWTRQLQIFSDSRVTTVSFVPKAMKDGVKQAEEVYQSLAGQGVRTQAPVPWIGNSTGLFSLN